MRRMPSEHPYWKVSSPSRSVYVQARTVLLALKKAKSLGLMHPLVATRVTPEEAYMRLSMEAQRG